MLKCEKVTEIFGMDCVSKSIAFLQTSLAQLVGTLCRRCPAFSVFFRQNCLYAQACQLHIRSLKTIGKLFLDKL